MHDLIDTPATKDCTGCQRNLPMSHFSPVKRGAFGRHSKCKECRNGAAQRKRTEGLEAPVDRRFTRTPPPFVQAEDGTFTKVRTARRAANTPDRALLDFLHRVARAGDVGNVAPRVS